MIKPIIIDTTTPDIASVFCVDHQLAAGDIVRIPGDGCYEIERIDVLERNAYGRIIRQRVTVRWEFGGIDVMEWTLSGIVRFEVVGGMKVCVANVDADAVYEVYDGWMWKENR